MNVDTWAFAATAAGTIAVVAIAAAVYQMTRRRTDAVVERLADPMAGSALQWQPLGGYLEKPRQSWLGAIAAALSILARPGRQEEIARIRARLYCAGLRGENAVSYFLFSKMLLAFGCLGAALYWNARRVDGAEPAFLIAVVAFAAGFYAPEVFVHGRVRARQGAIERGLADALDLLVTCVEAGLGLDAALQRVASEVRLAYAVLGDELATTFLEIKTGIPRVEGFRRLAERTGVKDLKSLAATLNQTEVFGTSVALALRIQAEGIRTRRMQRAEERAGYVAVKMTVPLILCILPALIAIVAGPAFVNAAKHMKTTEVTRSSR